MKTEITRGDFVKGIIRLLMVTFIAFIAIALGKRTVTGRNCTNCPVNGTCNGDIDCGKYRLNEK